MKMKINYVAKFEIVLDNGEVVSGELAEELRGLMTAFQEAKVLGDGSSVNETAALRMALVAIRYFHDFDGCAEAMEASGKAPWDQCGICKYLAQLGVHPGTGESDEDY